MRGLNLKKNAKIAKYDFAYREMMQNEEGELDSTEVQFVEEMRQCFFNFLKSYLDKAQ